MTPEQRTRARDHYQAEASVALRIEQLEAALTGLVDAISPDGRDNKCEPYFREPLKRARRALANVEAARTGASHA